MQLDIDFTRHARSSDPATSHAAAARVSEFAGTHCARILACLKKYGPQTVDDICARTGMQTQQVNKRLPDMQKAGLAAPSGLTAGSNSGREARIWLSL